MKKTFFFFAAVAVALASCSSDDTVTSNSTTALSNQPQEIGLTSFTQKPTRGPVTTTTYGHNDDFDVVAYLAAGGETQNDYFASTLFKYDYAGGAAEQGSERWAGTTPRYWPLTQSTINFLAVSNKAGEVAGKVSTAFGETGSDFAKISVTSLSGNQGYQQTDLMYAAGQGKVTQSGNALTFKDVSMVFEHALAMVGFQVKTSTPGTNAEIKINSITLNGAHYNGTYTITNDGNQDGYDGTAFTNNYKSTTDLTDPTSWTNMVGVWSGSAYTAVTQMVPKADYSNNPAEQSEALTSTPTAFGGSLLVVPDGSAADANGVNVATGFTINYSIKLGGITNTYTYTYTFAAAEKKWKQRMKYTYIIDITLQEIFVAAAVEPWQEANNNYIVTIPEFTYSENKVAGTYNVDNTEKTYNATIKGCAAETTYTLSEDADWITEVPASVTSDASGNLTFKFKVSANASDEKNAIITFTNSEHNTKVTIKQAAGA